MKKLKLGISVLFVLLALAVIANIFISSSAIFFSKDFLFKNYSSLGVIPLTIKLLLAIKILALIVFIFAVFIFIKAIILFSENRFFSNKLIRGFSKAGFLFFVAGFIGLVASFSVFFVDFEYQVYFNIDSRSLYVMLMILGLFLIMFKKVLESGRFLKQENDLTI